MRAWAVYGMGEVRGKEKFFEGKGNVFGAGGIRMSSSVGQGDYR